MRTFLHSTIGQTLSLVLLVFVSLQSKGQGLIPVPDITGATVESQAVFITEPLFGGKVEYRYTIISPSSAAGGIWLFKVDISSAERGGDFTLSGPSFRMFPVQGGVETAPMVTEANLFAPFDGIKGTEVLVVGQQAPSGWNGGLTRQGYAQFSAADMTFAITPGSSAGGYTIEINRPPTIREAIITPFWILAVEQEDDATEQDLLDAFQIEQSIPITTSVLGPLDIKIGGFPHYSRLSTDMRRAEFIGWVTDATLVNILSASLGTARNEVFIGNNGLAVAALENMLDLIDAADPAVSNQEFRDLVVLNVESLIELVPNLRNTFIPVFTATPLNAELEIDNSFQLTMRHFNSALDDNPPIEGLRILVRCVETFACANADQLVPGSAFRIDATGEQNFIYVGENAGLDVIEVVENDFEVFRRLALIEVYWTAEKDLVVPAFVPPIVMAGEGDIIFITDRTKNVGTQDVSVPTVTTYFISETNPIDIGTATILGERVVPPLAAGEFSDSIEVEFEIPAGFNGEFHFLAACADGNEEVTESNENNNCSFTEIEREFDAFMIVDDPGANTAPVAENQSVSTAENSATTITLVGQDDDGDTLTYSVEMNPSNGVLSGTAPNLTYTPNGGFSGSDSFTFSVNDGPEDSNVATVSITVVPAVDDCDDDDDSDSDSDSDLDNDSDSDSDSDSDNDVCEDNDDESDGDSDSDSDSDSNSDSS